MQELQLTVGWLTHLRIEPVDQDVLLLILDALQGANQAPGGVGQDMGGSRVGVALHVAHVELHVADAAHPQDEQRQAVVADTARLPDTGVCRQQVAILLHKFGDEGAADLLAALDNEFDPAGKLAQDVANRLYRRQPRYQLTLVVLDTAAIHLSVAPRRLEGWRLPEVEGLRRLHVVVVVAEQRPLGPTRCLTVDHRVAAGRHEPGFEARPPQETGHHLGRFLHAHVLTGDAGLSDELSQALQPPLRLLFDSPIDLSHPRSAAIHDRHLRSASSISGYEQIEDGRPNGLDYWSLRAARPANPRRSMHARPNPSWLRSSTKL